MLRRLMFRMIQLQRIRNMNESLGQQTIRGVGWSAVERLSYQGITFLIQIVLARLLTPDDYGVVAMLAICLRKLACRH